MVKFTYTTAAAGVPAGAVKRLPDALAAELVRLGIGYVGEGKKKAVSEPMKAKAVKVPAKKTKARKTASK